MNITEDEELELEFELAKAKLMSNKNPAKWGDVITQGLTKGAVGSLDMMVNTPENALNLGKMAAGVVATEAGYPEYAPEVSAPADWFKEKATKFGVLKQDIGETTPEQEVAGAAASGVGSAAFGGGLSGGIRQGALNLATAGVGAAAGEKTAQATGSELAGLAMSALLPFGVGLIPSSTRTAARLDKFVVDKTIKDAADLGYLTVPTGKVADFANRPKMLDVATSNNQKTTNDISRRSMEGFADAPLERKYLNTYRDTVYNQGYKPIEELSTIFGPARFKDDYLDDLINIEKKYTAESFVKGVPEQVSKLIDEYSVGEMTSRDMLREVKILRNKASRNIKSGDDVKVDLGFAQKDVADAIEKQIEVYLKKADVPEELLQGYRNARKNIAISHTIEEALIEGTGNVDASILARNYQKGDFMSGDLEVAARFGNFARTKPKELRAEGDNNSLFTFGHASGLAAGAMAADKLGIDPQYSPYIAALGAGAYHKLKDLLGYPIRKGMMTKMGQQNPDYTNIGINPKMAGPASLGFFQSIDQEQQ